MTTANQSTLTPQQQMNALVAVVAQGMLTALAVGGMSQFVAASMAGIASMGSGSKGASARAELSDIEERLRKLDYVLENYKSSVVSGRKHKSKLMQSHGLTVLPSVVEMRRKYPQLYATDRNLKLAEEGLDRLELKRMLLMKRRKELRSVLGLSTEEEIAPRVVYPATKKFIEPMQRY